jgi:hypothetical protein
MFDKHWKLNGWPTPKREFVFHPTRLWRFDFCWPDKKIALEIQGQGSHNTLSGMTKDYEKQHAAMQLGWQVIYCTANQLKDGSIYQVVLSFLGIKNNKPFTINSVKGKLQVWKTKEH